MRQKPIPAPLPLADPFVPEVAEPAPPPSESRPVLSVHRRESCACYWACLMRAACERWKGWSCFACDAYSEEPLDFVEALHILSIRLRGRRAVPLEGWADALAEAQRILEAGGPMPPLVVSPRPEVGRGIRQLTLFGRRPWLEAARAVGLEQVPAVIVARSACPMCSLDVLPGFELEPVSRLSFCRSCGGVLVARAEGVELIPARDWEAEQLRRYRRARQEQARDRARAVLPPLAAAAAATVAQLQLFGGAS